MTPAQQMLVENYKVIKTNNDKMILKMLVLLSHLCLKSGQVQTKCEGCKTETSWLTSSWKHQEEAECLENRNYTTK